MIFSFFLHMLLRGDVVTNYIVQLGDDIDTIAKSFGISSSEIIKDNDLSSDKLFIGQSLKINNTNIKSYITKENDTISSISSKFKIPVSYLLEYNDIYDLFLEPNQVVKLDSYDFDKFITYTVSSGDTLFSVAKKYNIDIQILKRDNHMVDNFLMLGQVLRIRINN